jgi:hypothetical protein
MSKTHSNVHPGSYKLAGRERQGEDIIHDRQKALLTQTRAALEHQAPNARPLPYEENRMPDKETLERAHQDEAEGKSPSTQAGEFVREEMHHIREGKHGARSTKQAIAIGLSKARRAGVKLGTPSTGPKSTRRKAALDSASGRHPHKVSVKRARATMKALKREGHSAASHDALARQARSSARRRTATQRSATARKAARTRRG